MEKLTYEEARDWFWTRTMVWLIPSTVISVAALYGYLTQALEPTAPRIQIAIGVGAANVLTALFCAFLSLQWPWMSSGRWFSFLLTGPLCTILASGTTFVLGGLALAVISSNTANVPTRNIADVVKAFVAQGPITTATRDLFDIFYRVLVYAIGASGFWGLVLGVWFSLRRDKYYVEIV